MKHRSYFRIFVVLSVFSMLFSAVGIPTMVVQAAGTYYVDNTVSCSDSGPGTLAQPYCTISQGAAVARAGDTVNVLHGSYAETVFLMTYSGTAGSPITFHAAPGVTMTGMSPSGFGSSFAISGRSYIVIDGFTISRTPNKGIYVDASDHITISNNHVSESGVTSLTHPYEQGIYLRNTTYSTITGNITDRNTCIGIRVVGGGYNLISKNTSYSNYSVVETDAAGIELTGSSNNTVINNITYSNEDSGINVYLWDTTVDVQSTYNLIIGNLSYENGDHGIDDNNSPYNTFIGNTVQGNGTVGINLEGEAMTGSHHGTLINNVSVGNGFTPPTASFGGNLRVDINSTDGTTLDYNLLDRQSAPVQMVWNNVDYLSLAAFQAAVPGQMVHGLEGDPLFVDPVPSALREDGEPYVGAGIVGDYNLMPGSPAIDSANADAPSEPQLDIAGNSRIDDPARPNTGAGIRTFDDRGAYEFQPPVGSCYRLVLSHSGEGSNPIASPANSSGCPANQYSAGATINLSGASPNLGWRIANWGGTNNDAGTASTNTLTMPASNRTVSVNYIQIEYTLTITSAHGTVTKNPNKTTYHYGDVVQLTAVPATGWTFANWSGDATGTNNPVSVTTNSNKTITANYTQNCYALTLSHTGQGSNPTASPTKSTACSTNGQYVYGATINLSGAVPTTGWQIGSWTGTSNDSSTASSNSLTMPASAGTVSVNYAQNQYTLTISSAHGTVTRNPDKGTYGHGEVVQLTAKPDHGWLFVNWTGDVTETANPISVAMNSNRNITANFARSGADTAGVFRPSNGLLYLKNRNESGFADMALNYGVPSDYPIVGDWDGNGTVTIGIYRNGFFYLRNENTNGFADVVFPFGQPGDQPIAGDWNGDGIDTIGVYSPSIGKFLLRNSNSEGAADVSFNLGNAGDIGIAGDWNGDGVDTTGVFRPSNGMIFLKDKNETGYADMALNYGMPGDKPVTGDWDNNGIDTIGVYRNGWFYLRNSNTNGFAEITFALGIPGDMPIAGNWDGLP